MTFFPRVYIFNRRIYFLKKIKDESILHFTIHTPIEWVYRPKYFKIKYIKSGAKKDYFPRSFGKKKHFCCQDIKKEEFFKGIKLFKGTVYLSNHIFFKLNNAQMVSSLFDVQ